MYSCTSRVKVRWSCITLTCSSSPSKYIRWLSFHRCCRPALRSATQLADEVELQVSSSHAVSARTYLEVTAVVFMLACGPWWGSNTSEASYLLQAVPRSLEHVSDGIILCQNGRLRIFHDSQSPLNLFLCCSRVSAKVTLVKFYIK